MRGVLELCLAMTLATQLRKERKALAGRWLELTLGTYANETSRFLRNERNAFANPLGQTLAIELRAIVDAFVDDAGPEEECTHLERVVKVRAFQGQPPSKVLSFVFLLKRAIRDLLGGSVRDKRVSKELAELEDHVDQMALFALDIFTKTRDAMWQLRIDEVKRSVSAVLRRIDWLDTGEDTGDDAEDDAGAGTGPLVDP